MTVFICTQSSTRILLFEEVPPILQRFTGVVFYFWVVFFSDSSSGANFILKNVKTALEVKTALLAY